MGYRVDYNLLDSMYEQLNSQATTWELELNSVKSALEKLQNTNNMSGVGADAIRAYFMQVHMELVESLIALVNLHNTNFGIYKMEYQQSIDTGLDSVIDEIELDNIMQSLDGMKNAAIEIDEEVRTILRQVKGFFVTPFRSVDDVAGIINTASNICSTLSQNINNLEKRHANQDFVNTGLAIELITSQINTYLTQSRYFKESYDPSNWNNANNSHQLGQLKSGLINDLNEKEEAAKAAVEYHEARKELENRIETAKWEKILVTGLVIVASAIVITALPVSGPLVVGLVNGVSSAIISGNNKYMDLYVEDGDVSEEDWKEVFIEGGKGAATGFVTGVVGGVAGKTISGLTKGIPAMQSTNTVVNTTTHVVIGATSDVATGIATRAAGEVVDQVSDDKEGIDWTEVKTKAFDGGEMIKDAVIGGVEGYYDGHKVDYSESMYSDYEQGILNDMYAKGELEYSVDPELDDANYISSDDLTYDMKPKVETTIVEDYIIKKKDDGLTWKERITLDNILSPDDYSHDKYDTEMGVKEALVKGEKTLDKADIIQNPLEDGNASIIKSHDEIIYDLNSECEAKASFSSGGGDGAGDGGTGGR